MRAERRKSLERRVRDIGPPSGCLERRQKIERRRPSATVMELSAEEFVRYFGSLGPSGNHGDCLDLDSDIFNRDRDRYR